MADKRSFKAVIVGGSVAGLTLAHTFEKAGINYVLLEARDTISPQLGASIVIMPNGARILDQMEIYEPMRDGDLLTPMVRSFIRRKDGTFVSSTEWPTLVEERLGYPAGICERRRFLHSLYDQLKDKSKILLNKRVRNISHSTDSVTVKCDDGSEFVGDIVVGADGIHSKTRQEMQRYAEATGPAGLMDDDKSSITAEYNCFFGISDPIASFNVGDNHVSSDIDHSTLLFVSHGSLPQWFFFSRMDKKYHEKEIPRFTKSQMEEVAKEYGDFHFTEEVTLKDMLAKTRSLSYLPLEEANHEFWTYGRIVCMGDAIHKMTPNFGQGGNQAIESAAVLTNNLVEMLSRTSEPDLTTGIIEDTLKKYQKLRQERAKTFVTLSALITRDEALATLRHTLRFLYMKPLSSEKLADIQVGLYSTAPCLNFLPLPRRLQDYKVWKVGEEKAKEGVVPRARL